MDRFIVSSNDDGRRLDKVLRALWPSLPLGAMMKAFRKKQVRVNGARADFDQRLLQGQEVVVPWEPMSQVSVSDGSVFGPLKTLYRDDSVWVIDKPAGLLSQPDVKDGDSVVSRARSAEGCFQPQAVHRLDRNTSGVMVLALTGKALRELSDLWREGGVTKTYLALVEGEITSPGRIDLPLLKNEETNKVVVDEKGKEALTLYTPLIRGRGCTLCEVTIVTGRSHQIRVHMAHIGHPVIGDVKYGDADPLRAGRPMLHARSLSFPWPKGGDNVVTVVAPVPGDMLKVCRTLAVDVEETRI